jgi:hypothetical protein
VDAPRLTKVSENLQDEETSLSDELKKDKEISLPEGWKMIEIKDKVTLGLPPDMKPAKLIGDSHAYGEAYSNREIYLTIGYGEFRPRRYEHDPPLDACDTRAIYLNDPAHRESDVEINGRKAKLAITHRFNPENMVASVCFPPDDKGIQLIVAAFGKDNRALQIAQQIFTSVKFKDNR